MNKETYERTMYATIVLLKLEAIEEKDSSILQRIEEAKEEIRELLNL